MDKFSVLPTDERFLNLYEEQKIALFEGILHLPDFDKQALMIVERINELKERDANSFVSKGMRERMTEIFQKQGKTEKEVEKMILEHGEKLKLTEIKSLEKKIYG